MSTAGERLERTERLLGADGVQRLRGSCVAVFGLGGVGSYCVEALARSGIGALMIVDHDVVSASNCNRQLHAMESTVGRAKAELMRARVTDIDPSIAVDARRVFFASDSADDLLDGKLSFVIDAIDAMGPKIELLVRCRALGIPVITALGAGAKLDPTRVRVAPLAKTAGCPMAARVRKMLRRRGGLDGITAVYSQEPPRKSAAEGLPAMTDDLFRGRQRVIQPSMVMVPATMGMVAAAHVVRAICGLGDDRTSTASPKCLPGSRDAPSAGEGAAGSPGTSQSGPRTG